jgi:hypothetical protein
MTKRTEPEPALIGWRVKDFADGWIFFGIDRMGDAMAEALRTGARIENVYAPPEGQP